MAFFTFHLLISHSAAAAAGRPGSITPPTNPGPPFNLRSGKNRLTIVSSRSGAFPSILRASSEDPERSTQRYTPREDDQYRCTTQPSWPTFSAKIISSLLHTAAAAALQLTQFPKKKRKKINYQFPEAARGGKTKQSENYDQTQKVGKKQRSK